MIPEKEEEYFVTRILEDAGCEKEMIEEYMGCEEKGMTKRKLCLLVKHREALLERIHDEHRRLDCLDHLIYKIKASCGKKQ